MLQRRLWLSISRSGVDRFAESGIKPFFFVSTALFLIRWYASHLWFLKTAHAPTHHRFASKLCDRRNKNIRHHVILLKNAVLRCLARALTIGDTVRDHSSHETKSLVHEWCTLVYRLNQRGPKHFYWHCLWCMHRSFVIIHTTIAFRIITKSRTCVRFSRVMRWR